MPLIIDESEKALIRTAFETTSAPWKDKSLEDLKRKIKDYYLSLKTPARCSYCQRSLNAEFRMVIDIEHILPKEQFPKYMFEPFNLNISCKRCNMNIKGRDISFIDSTNPIDIGSNEACQSSTYKLIHPNFDEFFNHIQRISKEYDQNTLVKYSVVKNSSKGHYTYDYFKLKEFEINSLNVIQGLRNRILPKPNAIKASLKTRIDKFLKTKI